MMIDLMTACADLAALMREAKTLAAPYDAQIKSLEVARADAVASLAFQIDTLKVLIRPLILAEQRSMRVDGLSVIYTQKQTWDTETLLAMAQELPAILQAQKDASYVSFR